MLNMGELFWVIQNVAEGETDLDQGGSCWICNRLDGSWASNVIMRGLIVLDVGKNRPNWATITFRSNVSSMWCSHKTHNWDGAGRIEEFGMEEFQQCSGH